MKVLFISSGNSGSISPVVHNQAKSLLEAENAPEIHFFLVEGKGFKGYLSNIPALRRKVRSLKPDLIHAHYSLCGILAALALTGVPVIVSLMGSDVKSGGWPGRIISMLSRRYWKATIIKSEDLGSTLRLYRKHVIPNGVDLSVFLPAGEKPVKDIPVILFAADPGRPEKNFTLAEKALDLIDKPFTLRTLVNVPHEQMPEEYAAADLVLLTSKWEGSPNVVKEAMACSLPVVSTDTGDVKTLFGDGKGLYLSPHDPEALARNIRLAMDYAAAEQYSEGRSRITGLGITSENIAKRIIRLYQTCLPS